MSLTEAEVEIANQALDKIGAKTFTYAIQTSNEGVKCNLHYEQTRKALQRSFEWNFANTRIKLAASWATATSYTTDQYVWESDYLFKCGTAHISTEFPLEIVYYEGEVVYYEGVPVIWITGEVTWTLYNTRPAFQYSYQYALPADFDRFRNLWRRTHQHWTIEGNLLLTDDSEVDALYVKKVTDPDDFDPLFTEILILQLALKLLHPLAGTKTSTLKQGLQWELVEALKRAKAICRAETEDAGRSDWNLARYGSGIITPARSATSG